VGTGQETVGIGSGSVRFPTDPNSKIEFEFKKMKKNSKILQGV
jgi:hypothetical protein